jgi:NADPH2:quinone reductase
MQTYRGFLIHHDSTGHHAGIEDLPRAEPAPGEVLIGVAYSSVNYKDASAGTGKGKILKTFPLVGGVDAVGVIERSNDGRLRVGDEVVVTGYGLSFDHDGGYAEYLRVPADWPVPIPSGLDLRSAMILGTAGFTAALAIHRMQVNGQRPDMGPILVTGATGGVGSLAVDLLTHLGYELAAVSGKPELHHWLRTLGASRVLGRDELPGEQRPLE